jgi:hypothetical protein
LTGISLNELVELGLGAGSIPAAPLNGIERWGLEDVARQEEEATGHRGKEDDAYEEK